MDNLFLVGIIGVLVAFSAFLAYRSGKESERLRESQKANENILKEAKQDNEIWQNRPADVNDAFNRMFRDSKD